MEGTYLVTGLGSFGFWLFVAVIVVAGIWARVRKRDVEHETLRRLLESGQQIDPRLVDKLALPVENNAEQMALNLKTGGIVALFMAPGLALLGWFIGQQSDRALLPLLGVAALIACIGAGLMVAAAVIRGENGKKKT